jgi:hypothetical protein
MAVVPLPLSGPVRPRRGAAVFAVALLAAACSSQNAVARDAGVNRVFANVRGVT